MKRIDIIGQNGNTGEHYLEEIDGFEIFVDVNYYHMWAVRPVGETDYNKTVHFQTQAECLSFILRYNKGDEV